MTPADSIRSVLLSVAPDADTSDDASIWDQLDSMGIVELLVKLEESGATHLLGNEEVLREGGPLESVGALIAYLEAQ